MRRDTDADLFDRTLRALLLAVVLALCFAQSACTVDQWTRWDTETYTVRKGDTVYGIAWRYGVDYRQLAAWNNLGSAYQIHPGQVLVLSAPAGSTGAKTTTARSSSSTPVGRTSKTTPNTSSKPAPGSTTSSNEASPSWVWPAPGPILAAYGASSSGKGIDIGGSKNSDVVAAAEGSVVYSGSGLIGYGQLIIIKHNNTFLSAYGHNSTLLVTQGDKVGKGQRIARMGEGPGKRPMLHFEIRVNGKPVDPLKYLPSR